ncbi:MAG: TAT-variant-translocated molybdopterin oxidoreductase [Bacteroidales bacterium]|nr:TAT-variant-translocated molybdopterin oxidoreductase [Bacteroidales bacterium]
MKKYWKSLEELKSIEESEYLSEQEGASQKNEKITSENKIGKITPSRRDF